MAYIVDPINNTLIDDEKQKQYKSLKMVELQLFRDPKTLMKEYKE